MRKVYNKYRKLFFVRKEKSVQFCTNTFKNFDEIDYFIGKYKQHIYSRINLTT